MRCSSWKCQSLWHTGCKNRQTLGPSFGSKYNFRCCLGQEKRLAFRQGRHGCESKKGGQTHSVIANSLPTSLAHRARVSKVPSSAVLTVSATKSEVAVARAISGATRVAGPLAGHTSASSTAVRLIVIRRAFRAGRQSKIRVAGTSAISEAPLVAGSLVAGTHTGAVCAIKP